MAAWLSGWGARIRVTVDSSKLTDANDLTQFPLTLICSGGTGGINGADLTPIFDHETYGVGGDNWEKIAVTAADGITELYVEKEDWDAVTYDFVLHCSAPTWVIDSETDTDLFLYFDTNHAVNTAHVSDDPSADFTNNELWDASYEAVWHLNNSLADSTSNGYDLTNDGATWQTTVKLHGEGAYEFVAADTDSLYVDNACGLTSLPFTLECQAYVNDVSSAYGLVWAGDKDATEAYSVILSRGDVAGDYAWAFQHKYGGAATAQEETTTSVTASEWEYIAGVFASGSNASHVFLNGEGKGSFTANAISGHDRVAIGIYSDATPSYPLDGYAGEVRVSSTDREDAWIIASNESQSDTLLNWHEIEVEGGAWLSGFDKRMKITLSDDNVTADLTHFPVPIFLTEADVFTEVEDSSTKIGITQADGLTQLYVEVEAWSDADDEAVLWASNSDFVLSSTADTILYLYYDGDHAGNTEFVGIAASTPSQAVWDENTVGAWNCAEASTPAKDSTSDNNLAFAGTPVRSAGANGFGYGYDFESGDVDYLDGGNVLGFDHDDTLTLECWVKPETEDVIQTIMSKRKYATPYTGYSMYALATNEIKFHLIDTAASTSRQVVTDNAFIAENTPCYIVVTSNGVNASGVSIYVDGVLVDKTVLFDTLTINSTLSTDSFNIGAVGDGNWPFDGIISSPRVHDVVRDSDWIKANYYFQKDATQLTFSSEEEAGDVWLDGWNKRMKISARPDDWEDGADLDHFPVLVTIKASAGYSGTDNTAILDELGAADGADRKKLAITDAGGIRQLFVEIESFDEEDAAYLWVSKHDFVLAFGNDTILYIYYDSSHADNDDYVGDIGDAVGQTVWDASHQMVHHMSGASYTLIKDSTSNDNDVTIQSSNAPDYEEVLNPGLGVNFIAADSEYLSIPDDDTLDADITDLTIEAVFDADILATDGLYILAGKYGPPGTRAYYLSLFDDDSDGDLQLRGYVSDGSNTTSVQGTQNVSINTLTYGAFTLLGSTGDASIFTNGLETGTSSSSVSGVDDSGHALLIGARLGSTSVIEKFFDGIITELRISKVVRSDPWIKANHYSQDDNLLVWGSEEVDTILLSLDETIAISSIATKSFGRAFAESMSMEGSSGSGSAKSLPETVSLSSNNTFEGIFVRSLAESLNISDGDIENIARVFSEDMSLSEALASSMSSIFGETVSLSDAYTIGFVLKELSETLTLSDQIPVLNTLYRVLSETMSLSSSEINDITKPLSESMSVADVVAKVISRELAETTTLLDANINAMSIVLSDEVVLSAEYSTANIYARILEEILKLSYTERFDSARSFLDSIALSDSSINSIARSVSEAVSLSDEESLAIVKSLSESVGVSDGDVQDIVKILSEAIGISGDFTREGVFYRTLSGELKLSDSIASSVAKAFADQVGLADDIDKQAAKNSEEVLRLSETISSAIGRTFMENITSADSASLSVGKAISEIIALQDSYSRSVNKTVAEALALSDSIVKAVNAVLPEGITVADDFESEYGNLLNASEDLKLDDQVAIALTLTRTLSEDFKLSDGDIEQVFMALAETLGIADEIHKAGVFGYSDAISLTESISYLVGKNTVESILLSDVLHNSYGLSRSESIALASSFTKAISLVRLFTEDIAISEDYVNSVFKSVSDTMSISDQVAVVLAFSRAFSEDIALSDGDVRNIEISLSEQFPIASALASAIEKRASENITFSDVMSLDIAKSFSDALGIADRVFFGKVLDLAESLALGDSTSIDISLLFQELLSIADSFITGGRNLSLSEVIAISDTIAKAVDMVKEENVALIDSNLFAISRLLAETLVLASRNNITGGEYSPEMNIVLSILKASIIAYRE